MAIAVESILDDLKSDTAAYTLTLNDTSYPLRNVDVIQIDNPVHRPTRRGDVYLEGSRSYRLKANVQNDLVPYLSRTMLGPNKEFGGIHIMARTTSGSFAIYGSLLNITTIKGSATLSITIVDLDCD